MFNFTNHRPRVVVDLPAGVYVCGVNSAVGKTYLAETFRKWSSMERVASCSFDTQVVAPMILDNSKNDIVMLDRYDLWDTKYTEEIERFGKNGIVIIDSKEHSVECQAMMCTVLLDGPGSILVRL